MPRAEETPQRYALQSAPLRRQRRILRLGLAWYLPGGVILTGLVALPASQPSGAVAAALIALSAGQMDYFAVAIVEHLRLIGRDLRRAGTPGGELVLDREGIRIGPEVIGWRDVDSVRIRRRGVPHVALAVRRPGGRRGKRVIRSGYYGVHLDELATALERFSPVADAGRPRKPARDDETGTITFFVNDWGLRAQRHRRLRSIVQLPLMLGPAVAGLFTVRQPFAAAWLLTVLCGLVLVQWPKMAQLSRLLRLSRGGLGRLLLAPEHLKLAGTDVPISWSHIHGATVTRSERPGLDGTVLCPDPDPEPRCRFRGRRISFHIADSLFYTTPDDIGAAFARYTYVDNGREGPGGTS